MDNILLPNEIELYIESIKFESMECLGSEQWLNEHNRLQKLNQQALIEAAALKEEFVKETFVSYQKLIVLIEQAIQINIWKYKILPKLIELNDNTESNTFIAYSILYHEGVCVSLLELCTYHANACEALNDSILDLLDYAICNICQLLNVKCTNGLNEKMDNETIKEELFRQRSNLIFEIGIRCLTILRNITENLNSLPISIYLQIYKTNDLPVLLTEILIIHPWFNEETTKQYVNGKWCEKKSEQLIQIEAQIWLTLRHILLDPECSNYYPITENRRNQLVKLLPLITTVLLDQLSPLYELKHWLCSISCMDQYASTNSKILLEPIMTIKDNILKQCNKKWNRIAEKQIYYIFSTNQEYLRDAAKHLADAYNTDLLEKFEKNTEEQHPSCYQCGAINALQRCSKCKNTWYCSRICQVKNWPQHKEHCH